MFREIFDPFEVYFFTVHVYYSFYVKRGFFHMQK